MNHLSNRGFSNLINYISFSGLVIFLLYGTYNYLYALDQKVGASTVYIDNAGNLNFGTVKSGGTTKLESAQQPDKAKKSVADEKVKTITSTNITIIDNTKLESQDKAEIKAVETTKPKRKIVKELKSTTKKNESQEQQKQNSEIIEGSTKNTQKSNVDQASNYIRTRDGITLWSIAANHTKDKNNIGKMVKAIYELNKFAFLNNDINLMQTGMKLAIPREESLGQQENTSHKEVIKTVVSIVSNLPAQNNHSNYSVTKLKESKQEAKKQDLVIKDFKQNLDVLSTASRERHLKTRAMLENKVEKKVTAQKIEVAKKPEPVVKDLKQNLDILATSSSARHLNTRALLENKVEKKVTQQKIEVAKKPEPAVKDLKQNLDILATTSTARHLNTRALLENKVEKKVTAQKIEVAKKSEAASQIIPPLQNQNAKKQENIDEVLRIVKSNMETNKYSANIISNIAIDTTASVDSLESISEDNNKIKTNEVANKQIQEIKEMEQQLITLSTIKEDIDNNQKKFDAMARQVTSKNNNKKHDMSELAMADVIMAKQKENQKLKDELLLIKAQLNKTKQVLASIAKNTSNQNRHVIVAKPSVNHQSQKLKVSAHIERMNNEPGMHSILKPLSKIDVQALISNQGNDRSN